MKCLRPFLVTVALMPVLVVGCNKSNSQNGGATSSNTTAPSPIKPAPTSSYKIASRRSTPKVNIIEVQVSPGSPNALLVQWSREIIKANKNQQNVQINFYDSKPDKNSLIARYENGKLFDPLRPNRVLMPK